MKRLCIIFLVPTLIFGCSSSSRRIKFEGNLAVVKTEIQNLVPVGSSVAEAKKLMEYDGFECTEKLNGKFVENISFRQHKQYEGIDFQNCVRDESEVSFGGATERKLSVAIVQQDDRVTDILVNIFMFTYTGF